MNAPGLSPAAGPAGPDEVLLRDVLQGDERAFRTLYRRHTPRLKRTILALVGDSTADADDVVQETWIRAVSGLPGFRGDAAFGTWLIGIGVRTSHELLRRRNRRREAAPERADPSSPPAHVGDHVDLERALATLSDQHRTVLLLHDVEGFTHGEIASQLGIAAGTSKAQLFYARRAMRTALGAPKEVTQ